MINVAIVGLGAISAAHIQGYMELSDRCRIVALVDNLAENAQAKAKQYNLDNVKIFSSHKELIGRKDIDLVSICTPPGLHADTACDLLLDGKSVLLEKPMAMSLEECDRIIKAAAGSKGKFSPVAQNRFRDSIVNMKNVLDSGMIGRIVHVQVDSLFWRGHNYYDLWWRGRWENEGGGCTLSHAVHHIDILCWIMGLPKRVTAVMTNTSHDNSEGEDLSASIMEYEGGVLGQLTSSVVHHGENQKIVFQGEKASVASPWELYTSVPRGNGFPEPNTKLEEEIQKYYDNLPKLKYTMHTGQIEDMLSAIEQDREPLVRAEDGRRSIELVTAIYQAGSTGIPATLPLTKDCPFYTAKGIARNALHFYEKKSFVRRFEEQRITTGSGKEQNKY